MDKDILDIVKAFTPTILGGIGIAITLIYNSANKTLSHQKMEKELFKEFNERYNELNEDLQLINQETTLEQLKSIKSKKNENKSLELVLMDYFNLCAEEFYWMKHKRISHEIWNAWHEGMNHYYSNFKVVQELWESERRNGWRSYYLKKGENFFN